MRIISGKYKGLQLVSFKDDHIRPTMDRVKETLYNKWMNVVEGSTVLDLFSGTGSLGLEALSRGAQHCSFVDQNKKSIRILKENIQKLKIPPSDYSIIEMDALSFLKKKNRAFDLILIDPPFTQKMAHEVMLALAQSECFQPETLISIESLKQERIEGEYPPIIRYDMKDYGDKILSLFHISSDK